MDVEGLLLTVDQLMPLCLPSSWGSSENSLPFDALQLRYFKILHQRILELHWFRLC